MAGKHVFGSKGADTKGTANLKEIGQLTCPLEEQLHPAKGG